MHRSILSSLITVWFIAFTSVSVSFAIEQQTSGANSLPHINIGIVTDGPITSRPGMIDLFKRDIISMTKDDFVVRFPQEMVLKADSTVSSINHHIDTLLQNPETHLILTLGTIGSTEALKRTNLDKPMVAPFVFDADLQKAPREGAGSGVKNLFYVNIGTPLDQELITFRKLVPFQKLAVLLDERDVRGVPETRKLVRNLGHEHSIDITLITVAKTASEAVAEIPDDVKAVAVGPLWQLPADELKKLSKMFIEKKIAGFSVANFDYVSLGFLATTMPEGSIKQTSRQVAINIQEILLGEKASTLPVTFSKGQRLTINMETARGIQVYPSLDYMTGARLLNEKRNDIERKLTLPQVVDEALIANLDLAVAEHEVLAGRFSVGEAKSALLPQLFVGTKAMTIDADRAAISQGTSPEKNWTGNLTLSQQLYSENSWAGYSVEQSLQSGREFNRDGVKLDIIYETSVNYLNVLRRTTVEQIQKDNMQLTQANLERAHTRMSIGVAGPAELYRWQTQFAQDRQVVLRAESATLDAMQSLNRILNRPLLEEFIAQETDLSDPLLVGGNRLFYELINNPFYMRKFNEFAVETGLEASPELNVLEAAIAAQDRLIVKSKREYWVPVISLEGDVEYQLADGGEGQRDEELTGLDDTAWQVGVFARLPIFEGGRRGKTLGRNQEELLRLKLEKRSVSELISQRIHQSLNNTRASYPSINLSRDAVDAARRNLNLVSDSYEQGIKSIIELLDAQNQALNAELDAANAVYNFLIDFMGVQRSIGMFITFMPSEEQAQWKERVKNYLHDQQVSQ